MGKNSLGNLKCNAVTFVHFTMFGLHCFLLAKVNMNSYVCYHDKSSVKGPFSTHGTMELGGWWFGGWQVIELQIYKLDIFGVNHLGRIH